MRSEQLNGGGEAQALWNNIIPHPLVLHFPILLPDSLFPQFQKRCSRKTGLIHQMSDEDRDGVSKSVGACSVSLAAISRGVGNTKTICDS